MEAESGLPDASLSTGPIIVASLMSCMASDVGMPVLLLSSCSFFEKARHSGPSSSILSLTTKPQLPQNISPLELSVTMEPLPQRGQRSPNMEISFTNSLTKTFFGSQPANINILFYYIKFTSGQKRVPIDRQFILECAASASLPS